MWTELSLEQKKARIEAGEYIEIDIQGRSFYVVSFQMVSSGGIEVEWFTQTDIPEDERAIYDKHVANAVTQILRERSANITGPVNG